VSVLVTGAGGFIGRPLLTRLAGAGEEVHALSTQVARPEISGVRWHRVDLADDTAVEREMARLAPARLVHLAWCTEHGRNWRAPENVIWVERSLHLMRAFVGRGGQRAVVLGTCAEYDWSSVGGRLGEHAPLAPATLYGVAKDALHRVLEAYAAQEGFELAWGRPFHLYGPREAPGRLVPSVIRALLARETVAIGSDERVRDFMHVEDVAGAVAALLDSSVVGAVNIATGIGVTVGEVVDSIVRAMGHPELVRRGALPDRPGEPWSLVADVARLRDEVGFRPRWELAQGLADTVRWWEAHAAGEHRLVGERTATEYSLTGDPSSDCEHRTAGERCAGAGDQAARRS
jgi:nucleoside-diphosphate-sugar epimerase